MGIAQAPAGTCRPRLRSAFPALSPARPPDSAAPLAGTKPPRGGLCSRAECSWVGGCEGGRLLSECWAQAPPALASVEGPELPEVPRPQREWLDQAPPRHASRGTGQCRVWAVGPGGRPACAGSFPRPAEQRIKTPALPSTCCSEGPGRALSPRVPSRFLDSPELGIAQKVAGDWALGRGAGAAPGAWPTGPTAQCPWVTRCHVHMAAPGSEAPVGRPARQVRGTRQPPALGAPRPSGL